MSFYYPTQNNATAKIYKYVNPDDQDLNEYWKVSYDHKTKTMTTKSFRSNFKPYNQFEERVSKERAELVGYTDFDEKQNEIVSNIVKTDVYNLVKDESYSYEVKYTNQWGRFEFEKKRKFANYELISVNNKEYKTAKFKDKYFIKAIDQNDQYNYEQFTYYAKDIGMVKYERFIPTGEVRVLELEDILTEEEFNKLRKASR